MAQKQRAVEAQQGQGSAPPEAQRPQDCPLSGLPLAGSALDPRTPRPL